MQTLFAAGKLDNAALEMEINILEICEVRWLGNSKCPTDDRILIE